MVEHTGSLAEPELSVTVVFALVAYFAAAGGQVLKLDL